MKILMLTPYLPYPLLTGGQTRSYNLIKRLSSLDHEITLFCLVKNAEEKKYVNELEKFCKEVKVFNRPPKPWTLKNIIRTGFSYYPFLVVRNHASGEKKAIEKKLREKEFDLIHAETFYVMPHIPKTAIPILLAEQTIEYLVYKHFVDNFWFFPLKPLLYFDVFKMKFWEIRYWKKASKVVAMSKEDTTSMLALDKDLDVDIVPNGVDSNFFKEKIYERENIPTILYLGNFTWLQNREAAQFLIKRVWPLIKMRVKDAKLWIVGKDAKEFFANVEGKDVVVEQIDDVRKAYQKSSLLVAPIYGGGGTRYKNFEAFASGLPVVTTSIGIGGTDAKDGKEVIIRNSAQDIAKAAVELLEDKEKYSEISSNAKKMVEEKYDWDPIAKKLSNLYQELGSNEA